MGESVRSLLGPARTLLTGMATTVVLLLLASVLIFALVRSAPGDPVDIEFGATGADALLSEEQRASERADRREELGLEGTLVEQYARWLGRAVRLDVGTSYRTGRPVSEEILERLPASAALGATGFLIALLLALGLALAGARRPGGVVDQVVRILALTMAAVPTFLSGSLLLRWAAESLDYPLAGPATVSRLWLPALVVGLSSTPTMARVLRASLIAETGQTYAWAARARGSGRSEVLLRDVLRPATTPLMTLAGLAFAALVAGSVITEAVFAWPGIGAYAVSAISAQDYPVMQAYLLVVVLVVVVVNRGVDAVQLVLDPRTRQGREAAG